jgi:hypothetical protein
MDLLPNEQNFDLDKSRQIFHDHSLKECQEDFFRKRYQFPVRNTK